MSKFKFWIQKAIKRPGRVRNYVKKRYGKKAFNKDGTIKQKYLFKAYQNAKSRSIKSAIRLALKLKKFSRVKKKKRLAKKRVGRKWKKMLRKKRMH